MARPVWLRRQAARKVSLSAVPSNIMLTRSTLTFLTTEAPNPDFRQNYGSGFHSGKIPDLRRRNLGAVLRHSIGHHSFSPLKPGRMATTASCI
jgi:hypothetical protein